jgi:Zn-dependent M28 family amino/carboxypeptidase
VVFAGYGVTAPDYDDYKNIDARGKIVALLTGAPARFPSEIRAHHSSSQTKLDNAVAHGAIGVITIRTPRDERFPWRAVAGRAEMGQMHWLEAGGTPHAVHPEILATATLSHEGAEALFAGAPYSLGDVFTQIGNDTVRSFALPQRATIHVASKHGEAESPNVIGILRGADPALRDQYVVYSAHLDHLGIGKQQGDAIYNGALDNASGIGAMLEIARLFAAGPKPRRSLLFLATTGEEKGLRGADYFANHPTVPKSAIAADINIDEILMLTPVTDVVALGAEHSTLGASVARAAKSAGVTVSPDPYPEEADFVRSDQYPFVRQGIPAVYIGAGYHATDAKIDAKKLQLDWIQTRYHKPSDDMSQPLDFTIGAMVAKVAWRTGLDVANRSARPSWNPGDFFAPR